VQPGVKLHAWSFLMSRQSGGGSDAGAVVSTRKSVARGATRMRGRKPGDPGDFVTQRHRQRPGASWLIPRPPGRHLAVLSQIQGIAALLYQLGDCEQC
jgi:hypothetical protein